MSRLTPSSNIPVLTIDGPGGSGKGTVSNLIALKLGWHYLDSGALYRIIGLIADEQCISYDNEIKLAEIATKMQVCFKSDGAYLQNRHIENLIRSEQAGNVASQIAAHTGVRKALLHWQRDRAVLPGLVADGRDMGTVVFPHSRCKIFLTASVEARAQRRFNQLRLKDFDVNIRQLFEEINERDRRDEERLVSPLKPAEDATVLDTTDLSIDEVVEKILSLLQETDAHPDL